MVLAMKETIKTETLTRTNDRVGFVPGVTHLALGKPWSTSSRWAECHPEHLACGNARTRVFFHTRRQKQP